MSWYYSNGSERLGPVGDDEWKQLVASGQIRPDTLVWRQGMADWVPYSALSQTVDPAASQAGFGVTVCAECGQATPADELVPIGGRAICASCKPMVLQRIKEGAAGITAEDPEALIQSIRATGYEVRAISCIRRAFALVKSRFWLSVGTTFILYIVMAAAGAIPCLGILASMALNGPVFGGLFWFFLHLIRNGDATVGDGFAGFSREVGQLMLCTVVSTGVIFLCFLPAIILIAVAQSDENPFPMVGLIAYLMAIIPVVYLGIAWFFAPALIIDKRLRFWPALEVSRKAVNMHWFRVFSLPLLMGVAVSAVIFVLVFFGMFLGFGMESLSGAGAVASGLAMIPVILGMFLAIIFIMPVFFAAMTYCYEDIFCQKPGRSRD